MQLVVVMYVVSLNGYRIVDYLRTPSFSFVNMARDVKEIVTNHRPGDRDAILLGDMANSISLETRIRSINVAGTRTIDWKIERYRPEYYLSLGARSDVIELLNMEYDLKQVSAWDVFDNYYDGKKVFLFELNAKAQEHQEVQQD